LPSPTASGVDGANPVAAASRSIVAFDEDVVVRKPLVRRAGLLARPALRFNHGVMMRDGERGRRRRIESGAR